MLTLLAEQPECLWDDTLPSEVKVLPQDLAALDVLLADPELLWPIVERFRREVLEDRRAVLTDGRPTIGCREAVAGLQRAARTPLGAGCSRQTGLWFAGATPACVIRWRCVHWGAGYRDAGT
jgi:hypothetical protein